MFLLFEQRELTNTSFHCNLHCQTHTKCDYHVHFEWKESQSPYHEEVQTLITILLNVASSKDFCQAFTLSESITFSVGFVYKWLVTNSISPEIMEKITAAVQDKELQHIMDVSIVQMFISRTTHQGREKNTPQNTCVEDCIEDDEI